MGISRGGPDLPPPLDANVQLISIYPFYLSIKVGAWGRGGSREGPDSVTYIKRSGVHVSVHPDSTGREFFSQKLATLSLSMPTYLGKRFILWEKLDTSQGATLTMSEMNLS